MEKSENCRDLLASLSDFLDGDLPVDLCAEIERHMSECENCRIVIDTLRKTVYLYRAAATSPAVPDDVRERLYHSLDLDEFLEK
jgi:anti-sigma factor (TIGR02949 family)